MGKYENDAIIQAKCPHCRGMVICPKAYNGQMVVCPHCGKNVDLSTPPPPPKPVEPPPPPKPVEPPPPPKPVEPPPPPKPVEPPPPQKISYTSSYCDDCDDYNDYEEYKEPLLVKIMTILSVICYIASGISVLPLIFAMVVGHGDGGVIVGSIITGVLCLFQALIYHGLSEYLSRSLYYQWNTSENTRQLVEMSKK